MGKSVYLHLSFKTENAYNGEWIKMNVSKSNIPHFNAKMKLHSVGMISIVSQNRYFNRENPTICEIRMFGETFRFTAGRKEVDSFFDRQRYSVGYVGAEMVSLYEVVDMYVGRVETYEDFLVEVRFLTGGVRLPHVFDGVTDLPMAFSMMNSSALPAESIRVLVLQSNVDTSLPIMTSGLSVDLENLDEPLMLIRNIGRGLGTSTVNVIDCFGVYDGVEKLIGRFRSPITSVVSNVSITQIPAEGVFTNEVIRITGLPVSGVFESGITRSSYDLTVPISVLWNEIGVSSSTQLSLGGLDVLTLFSNPASGFTTACSVSNLYTTWDVLRYIRFMYRMDVSGAESQTVIFQVYLTFEGLASEQFVYTFNVAQLVDNDLVFVEVDLHVFPTYVGGARLISVTLSPHQNNAGGFLVAFSPILLYGTDGTVRGKVAYPNDFSLRLEMGK